MSADKPESGDNFRENSPPASFNSADIFSKAGHDLVHSIENTASSLLKPLESTFQSTKSWLSGGEQARGEAAAAFAGTFNTKALTTHVSGGKNG